MRALIIVDVQKDHCPGGALPVPRGDEVVPVINALVGRFDVVAASKDWHPMGHVSFASTHGRHPGEAVLVTNRVLQRLWPDNCVQGTPGAEFAAGLDASRIEKTFLKGADPRVDGSSAFYDHEKESPTGLDNWLAGHRAEEVFITGLATEGCVKETALDARRLGFRTFVIADACRAVNVHPEDGERALEAMGDAGVRVILSRDVQEPVSAGSSQGGPQGPQGSASPPHHGGERFVMWSAPKAR